MLVVYGLGACLTVCNILWFVTCEYPTLLFRYGWRPDGYHLEEPVVSLANVNKTIFQAGLLNLKRTLSRENPEMAG